MRASRSPSRPGPTTTWRYLPSVPKLLRKLSSTMGNELREHLPGTKPPGCLHHAPRRYGSHREPDVKRCRYRSVRSDRKLHHPRWTHLRGGRAQHVPEREVANLALRLPVRHPPEERAARVQIHSRTLRDEREQWVRDQLEAFLGTVISRACSCEMRMKGVNCESSLSPQRKQDGTDTAPPEARRTGARGEQRPLSTAIFQRRIVEVLILGATLPRRSRRHVAAAPRTGGHRAEGNGASILDADKFAALNRVLGETGFDAILEAKRNDSERLERTSPSSSTELPVRPTTNGIARLHRSELVHHPR